jgi:NACalpha-BTF3-like transcription factor
METLPKIFESKEAMSDFDPKYIERCVKELGIDEENLDKITKNLIKLLKNSQIKFLNYEHLKEIISVRLDELLS